HQIIFRNTHPTRKNGRLYTKYICHFEKHLLFWSPNPTFILGNANIPIQAEPHHTSKFFLSHSSKNPYFFDTLSNGHRLHLTLGKLSIHFFVSCPKCTYDTSCCQIRICCLYFLSAASDCFKSRKSFLFHVHQKVRYRQLTQINTFFRGVVSEDFQIQNIVTVQAINIIFKNLLDRCRHGFQIIHPLSSFLLMVNPHPLRQIHHLLSAVSGD